MIRLFFGLLLAGILIVLLLQNLQVVSFNFLMWSFEASLSIMLLLTILITIGVTILVILPLTIINKLNKRKKDQESKKVKEKDNQAASSKSLDK